MYPDTTFALGQRVKIVHDKLAHLADPDDSLVGHTGVIKEIDTHHKTAGVKLDTPMEFESNPDVPWWMDYDELEAL